MFAQSSTKQISKHDNKPDFDLYFLLKSLFLGPKWTGKYFITKIENSRNHFCLFIGDPGEVFFSVEKSRDTFLLRWSLPNSTIWFHV